MLLFILLIYHFYLTNPNNKPIFASMIFDALGFVFCSIIILVAGTKLSYYGDLFATVFNLDKGWIGMFMLAFITTLPELTAGISSASFVGSADLAIANALGSCACNLAILSIIDFYLPKDRPIFGIATQAHILSVTLVLILLNLAGLGIFLKQDLQILPGIGFISFLFMIMYFFSVRLVYEYNKKIEPKEPDNSLNKPKNYPTKSKIIIAYVFFATLIVSAAIFLPDFADKIAKKTHLGTTFVGTLFLAVSTNLPEIAVSFAAVRSGLVDMAIGNLIGSCIYNIFILFIDDIFYLKGSLLFDASPNHLISIFFCVIMGCIIIISLMFQPNKKKYFFGFDTLLIFALYILNLFLLFKLG